MGILIYGIYPQHIISRDTVMKSVTLLAPDTTAANDQLHMQDEEKNICEKLFTILNCRTSAFQALNIDCIYSSSSIYSKWYCKKATTCLVAASGVSLSFSKQKLGLTVKSHRKVAHLCHFWCFREVSVDSTVCLSCWIINKLSHIRHGFSLFLLYTVLWEWNYFSSLKRKSTNEGKKLHYRSQL